ncbi:MULTISPECIES: TetR/AcrR family transcriptional regulator [Pseudoalteromonas]|jgi:TetR/AcrR family transcriptional repressor of nem operon|uniref:TetR/AcrR family transcriptional regulator, transcriptional repressor for nem operon n=1 Tax=Pseudoalteromonas aliena SW19 TaxID=1314866 RepID=A0ABR9E443_9GAMM|nr:MULTISPECIES: TetR/AcrR family transcriptional regulator [Pseudoalteromonas]MBE0361386.1 TetR/AcrR family transcriptional regulator, transcriptional repressor for nem operon [Pseudoalteromonas aliena SW19]MBG9990780.1 TetR/AcrR family transcriptional regulator [Pseudoalteromonas sp. NZS37]MBH0003371.1 TetR/AcrR family transcriptional regulator [Pseudoalteromonas sp. SWYJZ12]MBH0033538.1 TetR/AcrR family transcriptional regulator [Pseudoalteromonas sp. NZS71_1]MBH0079301.1 TetR/AcrR family t
MSKKEALLKAAENKVRLGGYSNFSFRELASEVGIKSASVHYHFPTKADLGAELAHQYTNSFLAALGEPSELKASGKNPIDVYTQLFRSALVTDRKMCLCGLLGAESDSLPDKVRLEVKRFFNQNLTWLSAAHLANGELNPTKAAIQTVSLLEGAMMISKTLDDNSYFELATQ